MRLAALAAVAAAVLAAAGPADPSASVYTAFRTPSGNIGCAYSTLAGEPGGLRCEIASGLRPLPPRRCPNGGEWGRAVQMSATGRAARICVTDTVLDPHARVLAYGRTWRIGRFTCTSRAAGLTCRNAARHGWFLSRARSRLL